MSKGKDSPNNFLLSKTDIFGGMTGGFLPRWRRSNASRLMWWLMRQYCKADLCVMNTSMPEV